MARKTVVACNANVHLADTEGFLIPLLSALVALFSHQLPRHHCDPSVTFPASLLRTTPSWYDEDAGHSEAQRTLMSRPVGAFLMWSTQNAAAGEFSLSVRCTHSARAFHAMINMII